MSNDFDRKLRTEVKDLNHTLKKAIRSSDRYTKAFMVLAFVQIAIGIFQYLLDAFYSNTNKWVGVFWMVLLATVIVYVIKQGLKDDNS